MRVSIKRQVRGVERHLKQYKCTTVALVGVKDTYLVRMLLVNYIRSLPLVVYPEMPPELLNAGQRAQQRLHIKQLDNWSRSYSQRMIVDTGSPRKALDRLPPDARFDAVILWDTILPHELESIGAAWSQRVVDGGWLLGLDFRIGPTRTLLNRVVPLWRPVSEGVWCVNINRDPDTSTDEEDEEQSIDFTSGLGEGLPEAGSEEGPLHAEEEDSDGSDLVEELVEEPVSRRRARAAARRARASAASEEPAEQDTAGADQDRGDTVPGDHIPAATTRASVRRRPSSRD